MTLPFIRRPEPAPVVVRILDEWRVIDGRWRRHVVLQHSDGRRTGGWILDEVAA